MIYHELWVVLNGLQHNAATIYIPNDLATQDYCRQLDPDTGLEDFPARQVGLYPHPAAFGRERAKPRENLCSPAY